MVGCTIRAHGKMSRPSWVKNGHQCLPKALGTGPKKESSWPEELLSPVRYQPRRSQSGSGQLPQLEVAGSLRRLPERDLFERHWHNVAVWVAHPSTFIMLDPLASVPAPFPPAGTAVKADLAVPIS